MLLVSIIHRVIWAEGSSKEAVEEGGELPQELLGRELYGEPVEDMLDGDFMIGTSTNLEYGEQVAEP
jgi:hypothetical protein